MSRSTSLLAVPLAVAVLSGCSSTPPPRCELSQLCDGGCVDTASDPLNCGGCGVTCASDQECVGGMCHEIQCAQFSVRCGNACVFTLNDPNNCGFCGFKCAADQLCDNSVCQAATDGGSDAGPNDAGGSDAGTPDAGSADGGTPDAGSADAGRSDAGAADAGCLSTGCDGGLSCCASTGVCYSSLCLSCCM